MHDRVERSVPGLSAWVLGGSYNGRRDLDDPGRRAIWQPLIEAVEGARTTAPARATDAITAGLEQRVGLHLSAQEHRAYRTLLGGGGHTPQDGVSMCVDCWAVFRPKRKRYAAKCGGCSHSPRPVTPAPRGRTPEAIREAHRAGWVPGRATVARQGDPDENGVRGGWRAVTVARCDCGRQIEGRRDVRRCSATCRSRAHRRAPTA